MANYFSPTVVARLVAALVLLTSFTSCFSPQPVDAAFKANRKQRVAVVTMEAPKASVHHLGGQGILDMALNQAFASKTRKRLEDYPSQAKLDEVGRQMVAKLRSSGYQADLMADHPKLKDFAPIIAKPSDKKPIPGRGTYLQSYDAVIYIAMPIVGQVQMVYGFIPLSDRNAAAVINGSMFETRTQKRIWRSPLGNPATNNVDVTGDGSNIDNVFQAIDRALQASSTTVMGHFFTGF